MKLPICPIHGPYKASKPRAVLRVALCLLALCVVFFLGMVNQVWADGSEVGGHEGGGQGSGVIQAQQGVIDLSSSALKVSAVLPLDGEWHLYWEQLYNPDTLPDYKDIFAGKRFLKQPGKWSVVNESLAPFGYATLSLNIILPIGHTQYLIKLPDMASAYKLWANGELVAVSGTVATNKEDEVPYFKPLIIPVYTTNGHLELILQLSNFHHGSGGIWHSVFIANTNQLFNVSTLSQVVDSLLFVPLLMMGLYFVLIGYLYQKNPAALFLGGFCLLVATRSVLVGERILYQAFPQLSWTFLQMLEHMVTYLTVPLFGWFTYCLFTKDVSKAVIGIVSIFCGAMAVFSVIFPVSGYITLNQIFQGFMLFAGVYAVVIVTRVLANKRKGAWLFALSFGILISTIIQYVGYTQLWHQSRPLTQIGVLACILAQVLLMNSRNVER